jgi:hypothetical protein
MVLLRPITSDLETETINMEDEDAPKVKRLEKL